MDAQPTSKDEPATAIARRMAASADRVIAMGGDGTVTEVAAGILAEGGGVPLAVVPLGTANILALNLGIPHDPAAAVELAALGDAWPIDVGRVNGEIFLLNKRDGVIRRLVP